MSKIFLDTNILVYSLDVRNPDKRHKCRELLATAAREHSPVISTQVMQEFFVAATTKLGVEPLAAKDVLHYLKKMEIVTITPALIDEAVDCGIINRLSFWDSLIIVAAESSNCEKIWTEDLNAGQKIRGVWIENPLLS